MKKIGTGLIFLLIASIGFASAATAASDGILTVIDKNDKEITVIIEDDAIGSIDKEKIEQVVNQSADLDGFSDTITIHGVSQGDEISDSLYLNDSPIGIMGVTFTKKYSYRSNGAAKFITSVARGASRTLGTEVTVTNSRSISVEGGVSLPKAVETKVNSNVTSTKTVTYSKSEKYNGPPSSSKAISRQFYNTPYYDYGSWTAVNSPLIGFDKTYKGTYREPSRQDPFVEWSRDVY